VRLWRVLPWDPSAAVGQPGHALWVPREYQGSGRHDAPDRYGCLYLAEVAVSAVAETLAPFRGTGDLHPELLVRSGRQLALAELELAGDATLIDLDDPAVLVTESLRPSIVATAAAGLRWWSTLEASWIQVTLFDRALGGLSVHGVRTLAVDDEAVAAAASYLGLA
jgi:hypothetical protein